MKHLKYSKEINDKKDFTLAKKSHALVFCDFHFIGDSV